MRRGLFLFTALVSCWAVQGGYNVELTPDNLVAAIGQEGLEQHLRALDKIAKENNNNRAFGTSGYAASSEYVLSQIKRDHGDVFRTWTQHFNHTYEETRKISVTGPDGEHVDVLSLMYNNATPLPDGVTGELVAVPVDDERGSGCFADQWTNVNVTGRLALIKRGTCSISDKLRLAKTHGALGVLLFHNTPSTPNTATLGAENIGLLAPVGLIPLSVGESYLARLLANETLHATLMVDSITEARPSWNIVAETHAGNPKHTIMLGAHLDSVQAGPGINDDASGVAAQLEIMRALATFPPSTTTPLQQNKLRFAFWGAEEAGLVGSLFYTAHLTPQQASSIRFYYNYDMIASPVPVYGVYAGANPADMAGAQLLLAYLVAAGKPAYYGGFGTGSDYLGFLQLGIPSSGIHTGGGVPADPCYHLSCDTVENVSWEALGVNTRAAGRAAAVMALGGEEAGNGTRGEWRSRAPRVEGWEGVQLEAAGGHTCALKTRRTI